MSDDVSLSPSSILKRARPQESEAHPEASDAIKRVKVDDGTAAGSDKVARAPSPDADGNEGGAEGSAPKKSKDAGRRDAAGYAKSRKGKEKDGKNKGRRRGTRPADSASNTESKAPRLPKRQTALLIGFCGTGCNGMQIQPDVRTIEGVLFGALVRAGAVSQDNADDPVKVSLGRAARTDAGVHAAGNLVSMKLITTIPGVNDIVARINEELPPEIRLWGHVRVQNSFNARMSCDSRKYTYFFPSYLLIPPKPGSGLHRTLGQHADSTKAPSDAIKPSHPFWGTGDTSTREDDLERKRKWRISADSIERLRLTVHKYEGTHNFHNFTVGREFGDRSNQRHMKKIEISEPAVYGGTEWISVLFHGQSFMLHQIRKMMAALVLSCRTDTPDQVIDELYGPRTVFIPKMPALGLLLEYPIFESYNRKVSAINNKLELTHPDYRPLIDFEMHRDDIDKFKQKYIYDNMRSIEDHSGIFDAWIRSIDMYAGNDLLYLNPRGIIPAAAVIKKGEKRDNVFRERKRFDATSFSAETKENLLTQDDEEEEDAVPLNRELLEDTEG